MSYANLPAGQREALDFVLDDLGWDGYLGFVREEKSSNPLHLGCSPTSRDFFTRVFEEALSKRAGAGS